jgi:GNAT superfamily N-acetyltransferase
MTAPPAADTGKTTVAAKPPRLAWVPIRSLAPRHRGRITAHLQALSDRDRYLRFGYPASDEQIARYVDELDFERDEVFGIFNRRLELVAMAHLAHAPQAEGVRRADAEFGVSVSAHARGKGLGSRLFDRAVLHARNRGGETLFIHALSENMAMLRIARQAGASVERAGSESEAHLKLPPETLASRMEALVEDGAAALDYRLKAQARRLDTLVDVIVEVKSGLKKTNRNASQ